MSEFERKKRPPIDRIEPNRSWTRAADLPLDPGAPPPAGRASDAVSQDDHVGYEAGYEAINGAYRLIDEYLRHGQRMAENLWLPLASDDAKRGSFNAPERFMRAMGDMTMAWMEVMQHWTSNVQAPPSDAPTGNAAPFTASRPGAAGPASAPPSPPASHPVGLGVCVEARGRVQVSVELAESSDPRNLTPTELRPFSGEAEAIREVKIEIDGDGQARLSIVVPDGQPAGTYNGLLVESDRHRPRGTVSLQVR